MFCFETIRLLLYNLNMNIRDINRGFTIIKSKIRSAELEAIKANNLDISELQWNYLVWVSENTNLKITDLAKVLGVQKGTLSNNIKYLVEKKLLTKSDNGRLVKINVTTKGREYIRLFTETHNKIRDELLKVINEDELASLVKIGTKLRDKY